MEIVEIALIFIGLMLAIIVAVLLFGKDRVKTTLSMPSAVPSITTKGLSGYYRAGRYAGRIEFAVVTIFLIPVISFGISMLFTDGLRYTYQLEWWMGYVGAIVAALIFSPTLLGRSLELNDGPSLVGWLFVPVMGFLVWLNLLIVKKKEPTFDPARYGKPHIAVAIAIAKAALIMTGVFFGIGILMMVVMQFSK